MLRESRMVPESDIWLIANSREEGLGDLGGMKAVVERFGDKVRGYLVLEGIALPHVYHRAVGVQRYRVRVNTAGGHSWSDYGRPSAVHEIASLISRLIALPLPDRPRTTMNVGTISGGTGINVVASQATFELDVRSESQAALAALTSKVEACIESVSREGVDLELEVIGQRPSGGIPADHPWVQLAGACLTEEGFSAQLSSGSTDANIPLSRGIPAIVLGITTGGRAHTPHEYIDVPPVRRGMRQVFSFVTRVMRSP
jgi:tripeptide aminopeptidase